MTKNEVRAHMRKIIDSSPLRDRQWAENAGVSASFLSMVLKGDKEPSDKVLSAFGLERKAASYRKISRAALNAGRAS